MREAINMMPQLSEQMNNSHENTAWPTLRDIKTFFTNENIKSV